MKNHEINFSVPRKILNSVLIPIKLKNGIFINVHLLDSSALGDQMHLFDASQVTKLFRSCNELLLLHLFTYHN